MDIIKGNWCSQSLFLKMHWNWPKNIILKSKHLVMSINFVWICLEKYFFVILSDILCVCVCLCWNQNSLLPKNRNAHHVLFEWDLFNIRLFCPQMFPFRIRFRYLFFFHSILHRYHNFDFEHYRLIFHSSLFEWIMMVISVV